ncbi:putative nucleic-acid-binding protein [Sphingomonas trueperi]
MRGTIVRAVDTNVLARFLIGDDPAQAAAAGEVLRSPVYVSNSVLLELGWLLQSRYRQPAHAVTRALRDLMDLPSVQVEDSGALAWALDRVAQGADLTDMFHLLAVGPATSFVTFARGIERAAGPNPPVTIETLA